VGSREVETKKVGGSRKVEVEVKVERAQERLEAKRQEIKVVIIMSYL
jgi:hypothetical protein